MENDGVEQAAEVAADIVEQAIDVAAADAATTEAETIAEAVTDSVRRADELIAELESEKEGAKWRERTEAELQLLRAEMQATLERVNSINPDQIRTETATALEAMRTELLASLASLAPPIQQQQPESGAAPAGPVEAAEVVAEAVAEAQPATPVLPPAGKRAARFL